jgi:hypothetical protein
MRKLWILAALAATSIAVAGCGGGGGSDRKVTLTLGGAASNLNQTACAKQEPFSQYPSAPAKVPYSGTVSPAPDGRWKVKLKLKRCGAGGNFQDVSGEQKIVGLPGGKFSGVFPVPESGFYSLRARYQGDNRPESEKVYLHVGK